MKIKMIGIDHSNAALDIRALFSFTKARTVTALEQLNQIEGIFGSVILSTCNRMELWLSVADEYEESLYDLVCRLKEVDDRSYEKYFTYRENEAAVDHLFRLTAGLESRILGEDQILSQVKDAVAFSRENYGTDKVMETLFRMAVTAGKKVKTDVVINHASHSVVDQALETLKDAGHVLEGKKCLVIGNGEMGKLTVLALQKENADVTVTVRQYHKGVVDIPMGSKRMNYIDRFEYIPECDYVFSATASPNLTMKAEDIDGRVNGKNITFVDLAVPRDIDPGIRNIEGITLFDLDDFKIDVRGPEVMDSIKQAEAILDEIMKDFYTWYDGKDLVPVINEIKEAVGKDVVWRMQKALKAVEDKEALEEEIDKAVQKAMNKILFELRENVSPETYKSALYGMKSLQEQI